MPEPDLAATCLRKWISTRLLRRRHSFNLTHSASDEWRLARGGGQSEASCHWQHLGQSSPWRASFRFAITSALRWQLQKALLDISSQLKVSNKRTLGHSACMFMAYVFLQ